MRTVIVISTTFNGNKKFVSSCFNRFDKKISVELSSDQDSAKDFLTQHEAQNIRDKIFNPFDRTYAVERLTIIPQARSVTTRGFFWLEKKVLE